MDEMRAALGLVQLDKLDEANASRKQLTEHYHRLLQGISDVQIPFRQLVDKTSAYHIYPILLGQRVNREKVFNSLKEKGIQASIHYPSIKTFTAYKDELRKYDVPNCDTISERELTLPLYPTLTLPQVALVVENLKAALMEQA